MASPGLILLDVDGVLNPYAASRNWLDRQFSGRKYELTPTFRTYRVWLSREHGPWLLDLAKDTGWELVWATTWQDHANTMIGPKVGLPELPVIYFPTKFSGAMIHHWKFGPVRDYAGNRPLAWFDDDFTRNGEDRQWFIAERGNRPTLLQEVSPHMGLQRTDIDAVRTWIKQLDHNEKSAESPRPAEENR